MAPLKSVRLSRPTLPSKVTLARGDDSSNLPGVRVRPVRARLDLPVAASRAPAGEAPEGEATPEALSALQVAVVGRARRARKDRFRPLDGSPAELRIHDRDLHYLYDSVLAFNRPVMNDPAFGGSFDFGAMERALFAGSLDPLLTEWSP